MTPALTVELVPSTCWFSNVRSNVSTADWEKCKQFVSKRSGRRCEVCGGRGPRWPVECHETWEYADGVQRLTGLIALCPDCHSVKHLGLAWKRGRGVEAILHLATVNGWTAELTDAYVDHAFNLHAARSLQEWTLDCSWLEEHLGIVIAESDRSHDW